MHRILTSSIHPLRLRHALFSIVEAANAPRGISTKNLRPLVREVAKSGFEWSRSFLGNEKLGFKIGEYDVDDDLDHMLDLMKASNLDRSYVKNTLPSQSPRSKYGHSPVIARTVSMNIYCKTSLIEYQEDGLTHVRRMAIHDDKVSNICRALNGTIHDIKRLLSFDFPLTHDSHLNCLLPDTLVSSGSDLNLLEGVKSTYKGPIIKILMSDGRRLSVTINHMLLTPNGFVRAGSLRKGDNVIGRRLRNWSIDNIPNSNKKPSRIQDVVSSLSKPISMGTEGMKVSSEDFHGDGVFMHGNIDIVRSDSKLWSTIQSSISEPIQHHPLAIGSNNSTLLSSFSPLDEFLYSSGLSLDGGMSSLRESKASFLSEFFHSNGRSFRGRSDLDAILLKNPIDSNICNVNGISNLNSGFPSNVSINNGSFINSSMSSVGNSEFSKFSIDSCISDTKLITDLINGFSTEIEPLEIVEIERCDYFGHVYDLHTMTSSYWAEGILSSNCRCTFVPFFDAGGYKPIHRDIPTKLNFLKFENAPREFEPWLRGLNKHITFEKVIFKKDLPSTYKVEGRLLFLNPKDASDPREVILAQEAKKVYDAKKFKEIMSLIDSGEIKSDETLNTPLEHFIHFFVEYKLNQLTEPVLIKFFASIK